jgi:hypothetical protein
MIIAALLGCFVLGYGLGFWAGYRGLYRILMFYSDK